MGRRALARVTFFFVKKKVTKETDSQTYGLRIPWRGGFRCPAAGVVPCGASWGRFAPILGNFLLSKESAEENHSNLRFRSLARGGQGANLAVYCGRGCSGHHCRSATACVHRRGGFRDRLPSHGRGIYLPVGDYYQSAYCGAKHRNGRWRLTPPGYGGTCLPAGRSAGSDMPPACHSIPRTTQGEGLRGASFNGAKALKGRLGRCGGRRKHLPWLGQAAASASAPVSVHAVRFD